jgi:hypothetical protein
LGSGSRQQLRGRGEQNGAVVRISAADVLPPSNLQPPTAHTFEELGIPASYRQAVEKELSGDEKMLWVGRPSRNPELHRNPTLQWIGIGMLVFAAGLGVINGVLAGGGLFGFVFAGALGVIGLVFLIPTFVSPATTCRYCYVVTNRRALLVEISLWQRGPVARCYLPQKLLGLERRDHPTVPGAGDLIFEYEFIIPGNTFNARTGSLIQPTTTGGVSNAPQRVPRGFMHLDQARDVEDLIRTNLLLPLEEALDTPRAAAAEPGAPEHPASVLSVACACGVILEAPSALAGTKLKCPRCAAAVALAPGEDAAGVAVAPVSCREDGSVPADLKAKALAGLDPKEKVVWIGQPDARLILLRSGGYLAAGGAGVLVALLWLVIALAPPRAAAPRPQGGKPAAAARTRLQASNLLLPAGLFLVSGCVAAVALLRWKTATRTCYALTNRRALVYKESPFGPTRDSYSPLEVSGMRRSDSWLFAGTGDLIFRTVQVVSTTSQRTGPWKTSVKTVHYGFLAVPELSAVEKLVRETLIDRFVDKLNQASAL